MLRLKPSALIIGVIACVPVLALHRLGLFDEMGAALLRMYREHFQAADLQPAPLLQYGWHTVAAFVSAWVCLELPRQLQRFAFLFGLVFMTALLSPVLALEGILFEPFSGSFAALAGGLLGIAFSGTEKGRREHQFRHFFIGRIDEDSYARLIQDHEPVKLTGKREVTSLTCRILNSAELAAGHEPQSVEQMSSAFLKAVSDFLVQQGAYLDICNSQGITVQFGFPVARDDHAIEACRVALALDRFLHELETEIDKRWLRRPVVGIALSSGPVLCGLIGHGAFQFYSVIGEPSEFSRRLCNMNGVYGSRIILATSTFAMVKTSVEVRPLELVATPGHTILREVYELLGQKGSLTPEQATARDAFWEGVVALRQGDGANAKAKFTKAKLKDHDDAPLRYFLERAESLGKDKPHVVKSEQAS
jgi:class 3 adenylate cyclase